MRFLYVNPDETTQARASELGCGWMPTVPPEFASVAAAPCVILSGAGQTVVLPEPTTRAAVDAAASPILAAEQAAAAAEAARQANLVLLTTKIDAAIATNIAALALPDPTPGNTTYLALPAIPAGTLTAAVLGNALRPVRLQVDALTRQNNALRDQVVALTRQITAIERHIANRLNDVSGT